MTSTSLALPSFDLNWASGFVDGEACIHIAKQTYQDLRRKTAYRLRLCIEQNDLQVLEHFLRGMKALGVHGVIYSKKREIGQNRQVYRLNFDEAMAALAFWTQGEAGRRFGAGGLPKHIALIREKLYWKLRSLK